MGYGGRLYVVNPRQDLLAGVRCHDAVGELPESPDVAFVAIPAESAIEVIRELSTMGAGGAICYASGFNELGQTDRHRRLIDSAGEMPVFGPNCHGYINAMDGAALWPDQHGLKKIADVDSGSVAIFSSSGNVSINITMQQRSLPVGLLVSVGNQAMVGIEHCIEAVIDDSRIRAIGIHIEGLNSLSLFVELAGRAAAAGKPVVCLKTGRSEIGARITMSHTATLAGQGALYDSLFDRVGVARVNDIETFLEALKLAVITGPIAGKRIASMSCSGGEASLIADLASETSLEFPSLAPAHAEQVRSTLNDYVAIDNPLDYHTFIWGDKQRLQATFGSMLRGGFDLTLLILDYPAVNDCVMEDWVDAGLAFADACQETGQRGAIVSLMAENFPEPVRVALAARGIAPLQGLRQAVEAIDALAVAGAARRSVLDIEPIKLPENRQTLVTTTEFDAKQLLASAGLAIPPGALVSTTDEAAAAASDLGYPVVLKVSDSALLHKTEQRAVVVGIKDDFQLRSEAERLLKIGEELLIEKMVPSPVVELLIGIASDSQFGHYLVVGSGGVLAELLADRQLLLLPVSAEDVRLALSKLACARLLDGYRGGAGADLDAVVEAALAVVKIVEKNRASIIEMEINPLMVGRPGEGAIAADALLVQHKPAP